MSLDNTVTGITLGTMHDLGLNDVSAAVAAKIITAHASTISGECRRCHRTLVPLIHDGQSPGPKQRVIFAGDRSVCDNCLRVPDVEPPLYRVCLCGHTENHHAPRERKLDTSCVGRKNGAEYHDMDSDECGCPSFADSGNVAQNRYSLL